MFKSRWWDFMENLTGVIFILLILMQKKSINCVFEVIISEMKKKLLTKSCCLAENSGRTSIHIISNVKSIFFGNLT